MTPTAVGHATRQSAVTEAWVQRYNNAVNNCDDQAVRWRWTAAATWW